MAGWRRWAGLALAWTLLLAPPVLAQRNLPAQPGERRVALVIGNNAYPRAPLNNPVNDANDISAKLRLLGFEVIERTNLKTSQIGRTLREFRTRLAPGSVALIFYAGHGLQIRGENYLPTIDADIEGEEDVPNQALSVRQMLELLDESKTRLNLVFLDACRNNPFSRKFRSAGDGLAKVTAASGTLISFATRPGSVAADGEGRNGLYTTHLLRAMDLANQPVEQALKRVVTGVRQASKGQQEPWMEGSIEGDFYFLPQAASPEASTANTTRSRQEAIDQAVQEALRRSNEQAAKDRAAFEASMAKMLQEALARQNALIESERKTRETAEASQKPAAPRGDEWEYVSHEEKQGKKQKLVFRTKAAVPGTGVLEELEVDGKLAHEWVFGSQLTAVGVPIESEFVVGPYWDGQMGGKATVVGPSLCTTVVGISCELDLKPAGTERISVGAGSFDARKYEGWLVVRNPGAGRSLSGRVTLWYSIQDRRLLKQVVAMNGTGTYFNFKTTLQLTAVRRDLR